MPPIIKNCEQDTSNPAWLTSDYMENALRSYHNDQALKVKEFEIMPAMGKGENYGSIIQRVKATYTIIKSKGGTNNNLTTNKSTFVIKMAPDCDDWAAAVMQPYDFFNRELKIYNEIIPQLKVILNEIGEDAKIFAETIKVDFENQALIFEDLNESGYQMLKRTEGLDMPHIKLLLTNLAKMHVATVILNRRENGALQRYDCGFFNRHTDIYKSFYVENVKACGRALCQIDDMKVYGEKLLKLPDIYMELGACVFDTVPEQVQVFNHGDMWTNNVMFKYSDADGESKVPINALLYDFQFAAWASPAVDLHYLFNTSLQEGIRLERQDELFQHYHGVYAKTMQAFSVCSSEIPTLRRFHIEMEEKLFYAFHSASVVQPVMLNEVNDDADFNALVGLDERGLRFKRTVYENKKVLNNLRVLIPKFERLGLLDIKQ